MAISNSPSFVNPSAVKAASLDNYVSTSATVTAGVFPRSVTPELVKKYGLQGITGFLGMIGSEAAVGQESFEHFEETLVHDDLVVGTAVSALTSGQVADATYAAAQSIVLAAGESSSDSMYVRVNDVVEFTHGDLALVTAVNYGTRTITVSPYKAWTTAFKGSSVTHGVAAGDTIIVVGSEYGAGTDQPDGLQPRVERYTNNVIIMKDSYEIDGSEATNITYFEVENPMNGQKGYLWYLKGEGDTYVRFQDHCELQLLLAERKTDDSSLAAGIRGTEGLIPAIKTNGIVQDYGNAVADFSLAKIDELIKEIDKQRGARENTLFCGLDLSLGIDDALGALNAHFDGGANYGTFNNDKDMAINLGFQTWQRGGYTFHKKTYDLFNHPKLLGSAGRNYGSSAIMIPGDYRKDARSGESKPSLMMRYKEAGGYNRKMEHWLTGSAVLKQATNSEDKLKAHYRTERGLELMGANRFAFITL